MFTKKKCWRTGPYIAIWPSVPWTICYILKFTREMPQINISRSVLWPYIDDKSTNNYTIITDMDGNIRIYGLPTDQWRLYCRRRLKYQLHGPYHDPMAICLSWYCPPYQYILCLLHWRPESDTHNINTHNLLTESGNVIWTAILGLNKILHTNKCWYRRV